MGAKNRVIGGDFVNAKIEIGMFGKPKLTTLLKNKTLDKKL